MSAPKTLYDKIWDAHVAHEADDGTCLLYIDRHLVHEVTSPQAFEGLRMAGRNVRAPNKTIAVPDHNVPTTEDRVKGIDNEESRIQVDALDANAKEFGIHYYPVSDVRQGIVHIVGPEQGWTLPGMTVVCGDSHTATHGAFGSLAHGIGTSEVEHVLATQTLIQKKSKNMIRLSGMSNGDVWNGYGEDNDGNKMTWTATMSGAADAAKADSAKKKMPSKLGAVTFPFTAFGWTEAPKQESILFKNATVWTNEAEGKLENTDVLVKDGKIAQIGKVFYSF